jgi:arylsulfatase A-like enzyme
MGWLLNNFDSISMMRHMMRCLLTAVLTLLINACSTHGTKPNIIVIMADDMGFSDLGCYGGEIRTPNLDTLAANGLRFSQFYNASRCCPSRASLLTGLYAHQTGLGYMTAADYGLPGYRADLNDQCVTIAEVLQSEGYHTYMSGKWHLTRNILEDGARNNWPLQRGFDRFYGTLIAAGSFWDPITLMRDNDFIKPEGDFYYTEAISENAADYIQDTEPGEPFFLYVAYTAPHWPIHARKEVIDMYEGRFLKGWEELRQERYERMLKMGILQPGWPLSHSDTLKSGSWRNALHKDWEQQRMEVYAAMIDQMDQGVRKILEALEKKGEMENTLIFFLSDNGGEDLEHRNGEIGDTGKPWNIMVYVPLKTRDGRDVIAGDIPGLMPGPDDTYQGYGQWANLSNTPFRKYKTYVHEGGISTPFIVHWPAGIRARNEWRKQPAHIIDLLPTCLEAAGADYPLKFHGNQITPVEGQSLLPIFENIPSGHEALFWEHEGNRAVRQGQWKLVSEFPDSWELYNLEADRTELNNLAGEHPDQVKELEELYNDWAERCNVIPWSEMEIQKIPTGKNPLLRTDSLVK